MNDTAIPETGLAARVLRVAEPLVFGQRAIMLVLLAVVTLWLGWQASQISVDAGFQKQLPLAHPYVETYLEHQAAFGGANLVAVALRTDGPDIYNAEFFDALKQVTSQVFFVPGVDKATVWSLFTPGVRYLEITDDGFASDDVVPRDYQPSPQAFAAIRGNVAKSGVIGRLVANDQRGALVIAELLEFDPATGDKLDYTAVAKHLEAIRAEHSSTNISIHIIGFAKIVGDVVDAAGEVLLFFGVALLITFALLWLYCASFRLALLPMIVALVAVVWEFGLLQVLGFGLDPFAILVPFLVLSIGVSHGIQMVNAWVAEMAANPQLTPLQGSKASFRLLAIPGTVALITDVIGFATIYLIDIDIIQEMAINAALGMAAIIVTNKLLLPILLSYVHLPDPQQFVDRQAKRTAALNRIWRVLALTATRPAAILILLAGSGALWWSVIAYDDLEIGDLQTGVPELRPDSRYNIDARTIAANFAVSVDQMKIIAEAPAESCNAFAILDEIDRLTWHLQNTDGVVAAASLATVARRVPVGMNEGNPQWQGLPRNIYRLAAATRAIPSSAGLANPDCSVMPVLVYTTDHRAETIDRVVDVVEDFAAGSQVPNLEFRLASGNLGVMAATNDVIAAKEKEIVLWVYAVLIVFIFLFFRSKAAITCAVLPLALTSMLTYAFMAQVGIGLKVATLPIVALGVGIGVDDSLYLLSVLQRRLRLGENLRTAWFHTLQRTGRAVVFTSVALMASVATWLWSDLQFQADMGLLLVFMFAVNLLGAVVILPAIAHFAIRPGSRLTR